MNSSLHITAVLDQPGLLENLVEKLASRRFEKRCSGETMTQDWEAIETSSTETYISGTLSFSGLTKNENDTINMHFITSMLFTCIRGKENQYRLTWSSSLS